MTDAHPLCQDVHVPDYDLTRMRELGERYERMRAEADEVRLALVAEVEAAEAADVRQVDIAKASRLTRERIRQLRVARDKAAVETAAAKRTRKPAK